MFVLLLSSTCFLLACEKGISSQEGGPSNALVPAQPSLPRETAHSQQRDIKPRELLVYGVPECDFKSDTAHLYPEIGKPFRLRIYFQNRLTRKHLYPKFWVGPSGKNNVEIVKFESFKKDYFEINEMAFVDAWLKVNKQQNDVFAIDFYSDSEDGQNNNKIGSWDCVIFHTTVVHQKEYPWNEESRPESAALRRLFGLKVSDHLNKLERQEFAGSKALIPGHYYRELPLPSWFDEIHKEPETRKH